MHLLLLIILVIDIKVIVGLATMNNIVIDEYSDNGIKLKSFSLPISSSISEVKSKIINNEKKNSFNLNSYKIFNIVKTALLPIGYPNTVPSEYIDYQKWNMVQAMCSYFRTIMSTASVLEGFGVGNPDMTAVGAAVQWIIRDGVSLLGGLAFTLVSAGSFGQHVKGWRLFADNINNLALGLDMLAPLSKKYFLLIICFASLCKCLCGVSAGAVNAAIMSHFGSEHQNVADIQSKNGAQWTVVNLILLLVSIRFTEFATKNSIRMWTIYGLLTILHMYANISMMKILSLNTLNIDRFSILTKRILNSSALLKEAIINSNSKIDDSSIQKEIETFILSSSSISLSSVARNDNLFPFDLSYYLHQIQKKDYYTHLWCPLSLIMKRIPTAEISKKFNNNNDDNYVIFKSDSYKQIYVCFSDKANSIDYARAIVEANLYNIDNNIASATSKKYMSIIFPTILPSLNKRSWDTSKLLLKPHNAKVYKLNV